MMATPTPLPTPNLGTISFCDRIRFNVKSDAFKAAVVQRLDALGARILRRHYVPFESFQQPFQQPHLVSLRSHGNAYFLFFTRSEPGAPGMLLFVDRKIQQGYTVPRIIVAHGRFDDALFDGTVIDGEMVKTPTGWAFLGNDLLALEGRSRYGDGLVARLVAMHAVFTARRDVDLTLDPCVYQVKRNEPLSADGVASLRAFEAELGYPTRGLLIRPLAPRGKTVCLDYNPELVRRATPLPPRETADFRLAPAAPPPPAVEASVATKRALQLRRTALPDVYDLADPKGGVGLGVAHVPTARLSAELRLAFRGLALGATLTRECEFRPHFGKWEPV